MSEEKKITRRNFLRAAGLVGGAAAVAACAAPAPAPAPTAAPAAAAPTEAPAAAPTAAPVVGKPFDGKTLKMHAISGANYDELYKLIPAWEEKTGAKVEFVFKGNGFETDKRLVPGYVRRHGGLRCVLGSLQLLLAVRQARRP